MSELRQMLYRNVGTRKTCFIQPLNEFLYKNKFK